MDAAAKSATDEINMKMTSRWHGMKNIEADQEASFYLPEGVYDPTDENIVCLMILREFSKYKGKHRLRLEMSPEKALGLAATLINRALKKKFDK